MEGIGKRRFSAAAIALIVPLAALLSLVEPLSARDLPWCPKPLPKLDALGECGWDRAGHPECLAWWARPGYSPQETGYYIGGGKAFHGAPRFSEEGTWGWDYFLHKSPPHVQLKWSHGGAYQDGRGQYQTDGPKLRPEP